MRLRFLVSEIGIGLRRNLTMTFAMIITVALSLALVGVGLVIRQQTSDMKGYWYDKIQVSIFLKGDVTAAQRDTLRQQLATDPLVAKVYYEDRAQAYQHFRDEFRDQPDLANNTLPDSLPESFRVQLHDPHQAQQLAAEYDPALHPGIDQVQDQRSLLAPLFGFLARLQGAAYYAAAAALAAAVILISNTVRLAAFNRRRETGIMRLVGASRAYIQLPFLLEGAVAGLVGAGLACGVLLVVKGQLIDGLLSSHGGTGSLFGRQVEWGEIVAMMPILLILGVVLTSLASFITLRRYLRV